MLASDELRAWYGPEHVALAVDRGAVGTLLISDDLFRCVVLCLGLKALLIRGDHLPTFALGPGDSPSH
jgi:hypothetical protein